MMSICRLSCNLPIALILWGCTSANWQAVYHKFNTDTAGTAQSIAIDAKQRAIISVAAKPDDSLLGKVW